MDYQTLNLLLRYGRQFSHRRLRATAFSETECMICSYICAHERCSQDEVAIALKADKTTIGKALAALEKKGCVTREQDSADRRIKRLSLTELGHERIAEVVSLHNRWMSELLACLSEEDRTHFESVFMRLLDEAERIAQNTEVTHHEA